MGKHTKKRQYWNSDQEQVVLKHYADSTPQELEMLLNNVFVAAQINHKAKKLGVKKSDEYLIRFGILENGKFCKNRNTHNKGKRFISGGRSIETRFKPGLTPPNHKPVGSTRTTVDGYLEIKVAEGRRQWKPLHHKVWKDTHGIYPEKGTAIIFRDGNKKNCNIDNLELISRKQLMQRNTVHNLPEELKEVIRLKSSLMRRINDKQGKRRNNAA